MWYWDGEKDTCFFWCWQTKEGLGKRTTPNNNRAKTERAREIERKREEKKSIIGKEFNENRTSCCYSLRVIHSVTFCIRAKWKSVRARFNMFRTRAHILFLIDLGPAFTWNSNSGRMNVFVLKIERASAHFQWIFIQNEKKNHKIENKRHYCNLDAISVDMQRMRRSKFSGKLPFSLFQPFYLISL